MKAAAPVFKRRFCIKMKPSFFVIGQQLLKLSVNYVTMLLSILYEEGGNGS